MPMPVCCRPIYKKKEKSEGKEAAVMAEERRGVEPKKTTAKRYMASSSLFPLRWVVSGV